MTTLFWLLVGHSLADYPLQGDYLAAAKRPGGKETAWWIALSAHSLIHAGVVALVTGSIAIGVCEFVAHWTIDYLKCRGFVGYTADQGLHIACKVTWAVLLA
jgi:hypothetical protein